MTKYQRSKIEIDRIREEFGEPIFRMAISHLMDVGIRHLGELETQTSIDIIMASDDTNNILPNHVLCNVVRAAHQLAKVDHVDLLIYNQTEVEYGMDYGMINYSRLMQLLVNCIDTICSDQTSKDALNSLYDIGMDEEEIEGLGFGDLLYEEED